jgi:biotin synthase
MFDRYERLARQALADEAPGRDDARWMLDGRDVALLALLEAAYTPRRSHFGNKVKVHILNNVQNGLCPEDCGYCAQRKGTTAPIRPYPMKPTEQILAEAEAAVSAGASRYCLVLSGRGPSLQRARELAKVVRAIKARWPIEVCVSFGLLDDEHAKFLADAGLDRLNHNLNTSEHHYPAICSTHTYAERLATLQAAKRNGLALCSGIIAGMGETSDDLVDVAFALRELGAASIPVNFLLPIEGSAIQSDGSLTPHRCLRILAMMRLVNPRAEIRAAAGREFHLRGLAPLLLWPANSLFVEGYLTTEGDAVGETYRMIRDAGFEIEGNPVYEAGEAAGEDACGGFALPRHDPQVPA